VTAGPLRVDSDPAVAAARVRPPFLR